MSAWIWVGLGGALGAIARFGVQRVLAVYPTLPLATLTVNVLGSFFIGYLAALILARTGTDDLRLFLVTGFLGAFTTFSTFSLETLHLFQQGEVFRGVLNVAANVLFCLLAVWLGFVLARQFMQG